MKKLKYQLVSNGTMGKQINLRLSDQMLLRVKNHAKKNGYDNVQEFIRETLRQTIVEERLTKKEIELVSKVIEVTKRKGSWSTEEELFKKLRG